MARFATQRRTAPLLVMLALLGLTACSLFAANHPPAVPQPDPWETPDTQAAAPAQACTPVPEVFIVPVPPPQREEAVRRLERAPVVALTPQQALALGAPPDPRTPTRATATGAILAAIARVETHQLLQLAQDPGSWNPTQQKQLDELIALGRTPSLEKRQPFLVRAIGKAEAGSFSADLCGEFLSIRHGSLGTTVPASIRLPVIIFLETQPASVQSFWNRAM